MVLLACAAIVEAQTLTSTVSGVIRDTQGGVLPGVTVTLTGRTGTRTALTDAAGAYRFQAVDPDCLGHQAC
jgi:hypothetical protein